MRQASAGENARNRRKNINSKSGYKGVNWSKAAKKWRAQIRNGNGKKTHLGLFVSPIEAALAYDEAAIKYHGEFAKTNF